MTQPVEKNDDPSRLLKLWNLRRLSFPLLAQKLSWIVREKISDWVFDQIIARQAFDSVPRPTLEHLGINSSSATSTLMLKKIFRLYHIQPHEVLVDVGCGRGRVIAWWLNMGCNNKIYGYELDDDIASLAKKKFAGHENVTIISGNILDRFPTDADVFYLANPFGAKTTGEFKSRLVETYYGKKEIAIVSFYCMHIDVFRNDPRFNIQEIDFPKWSVARDSGFPWYAVIRLTASSGKNEGS